jgi:nucleotide-binding universal stress UspA family protein
MIEIKHVLCPIDFSDFSRHALDHAAAIAGWYEARLSVLHVVPNLLSLELALAPVDDQERERLMAHLKRFTEHIPRTVCLDLQLEEAADVHRAIVDQANAVNADLLVIGSHGRSGINRLLLGSIAEKMLRIAPCPILVVPRRAQDRPPEGPVQFRSILCPIDFSDSSLLALEHALTAAEEADAKLTLLHVIEVRPELSEFPFAAALDFVSLHAAAEADALRRLQALIPEQARTYCTVASVVHEGAPYRAIVNTAAEQQADLIVMGVHGRGAIDRLVFGSNTERVARQSTCPLLIVRDVS